MHMTDTDTRRGLDRIVGDTPQMQTIFEMIEKAAAIEMPILIMGETGTGKELVARAIHELSARRERRYVAINTGAVTKELIASEVFGHKRGAFTDATGDRRGVYELADGGTLFLDEIGTMSESLQVSLLRVLEYGTFRRVGGEQDIKADVRLIAATNVDIEERVNQGLFRGDLLHRLKVLCLKIPPLRNRRDDIPLLANHFREELCTEFDFQIDSICDGAMEYLRNGYDWPGNVRELRNVMAQACVMAEDTTIEPKHLPDRICSKSAHEAVPVDCDSGLYDNGASQGTREAKNNGSGHSVKQAEPMIDASSHEATPGLMVPVGRSFDDVLREYAALTLAYCNNNKTKAASILGVTRKTLHERLQRWNALDHIEEPAE